MTGHVERLRIFGFDEAWKKAVEGSFALDLPEPEIPRQRKKSTRIDSNNNAVSYLKINRNLADLIPEYVKFQKLLLTIPASSCTAERSFSAMQRLKNHLRTSMKAKRLNHVTILHVHLDLVDELLQNNDSRVNIVNKFISCN